MNAADLRSSDLRRMLAHEHAHCLIARHYGVHAHVRIDRNPNGGADEKFYFGKCHFFASTATKHALRLIGLAGVAAELLVGNSEADEGDLEDVLCIDGLSETDAEYAGEYRYCDLVAVLKLVRKLWPQIEQEIEWGMRMEQTI
jgi:hypothetical protein